MPVSQPDYPHRAFESLQSFGTCLRGPVASGFEKNVVETFVASINIRIYHNFKFTRKKGKKLQPKLIDEQSFEGAAFEFGRQYLCDVNPCNV